MDKEVRGDPSSQESAGLSEPGTNPKGRDGDLNVQHISTDGTGLVPALHPVFCLLQYIDLSKASLCTCAFQGRDFSITRFTDGISDPQLSVPGSPHLIPTLRDWDCLGLKL